jgi:hypothetical protein
MSCLPILGVCHQSPHEIRTVNASNILASTEFSNPDQGHSIRTYESSFLMNTEEIGVILAANNAVHIAKDNVTFLAFAYVLEEEIGGFR